MSLYELESLMRSLDPKTSGYDPTEEEWEEAHDILAAAISHLPDMKV